MGAGSWPAVSEVLWQLMGHDEAGAPVSVFCPRGCWRVYQNVRGSWLQHTSGVNVYDIQLALACPHKEKGIEVAVTCMCAFEKKKEHVIFLFFSVQH